VSMSNHSRRNGETMRLANNGPTHKIQMTKVHTYLTHTVALDHREITSTT